eukprot:scaffold26482_cov62-Phaeocystis_antarctica.AAC.1
MKAPPPIPIQAVQPSEVMLDSSSKTPAPRLGVVTGRGGGGGATRGDGGDNHFGGSGGGGEGAARVTTTVTPSALHRVDPHFFHGREESGRVWRCADQFELQVDARRRHTQRAVALRRVAGEVHHEPGLDVVPHVLIEIAHVARHLEGDHDLGACDRAELGPRREGRRRHVAAPKVHGAAPMLAVVSVARSAPRLSRFVLGRRRHTARVVVEGQHGERLAARVGAGGAPRLQRAARRAHLGEVGVDAVGRVGRGAALEHGGGRVMVVVAAAAVVVVVVVALDALVKVVVAVAVVEHCVGRKLTVIGLAKVADRHRHGAIRIRPGFVGAHGIHDRHEADAARVAVGARRAGHDALYALLLTVSLAEVADHCRPGAIRIRPGIVGALAPSERHKADAARVSVGAR